MKYVFCLAKNPATGRYRQFDCSKTRIMGVAWVSPDGKYPGSTDKAFEKMRPQCAAALKRVTGVKWPSESTWVFNYTADLSKSNYRKSVWLCGRERA